MRNFMRDARRAAKAGSWFAALALGALTFSADAFAGDGLGLRRSYGDAAIVTHTAHTSHLKLTHRDRLPQTREVRIGTSKSMLVELPSDLRDVVVSNPEILDAVVQTSNRVYLIGKKVGQANAFFFDGSGEQVLTLEVNVGLDTLPLDRVLARLIPGSRIKSEMLNDTVILTGTVNNAGDANTAGDIAARFSETREPGGDQESRKKVINLIAVEGVEQVMLRVQVAEVQRTALKQLGVNLGARINSGNFATALLTENALPLTAAQGLGTLPLPGVESGSLNFYNSTIQNGENFVFGNSGAASFYNGSFGSVGHTIRALERHGLIRTLAEPNLTAVSGETANFLAGGEYPVPIVDQDGRLGVDFKEFGVGLAFTPNVLSAGRISLKIETQVSELSNNGAVELNNISIPALKKRTAKTVVELPSGGSFAIAGLISNDTRQNVDGVPGLKNVPVLGTLFRSNDFVKSETELVVIVTPFTVRPTHSRNLGSPGKGLVAATDKRRNFMGHLNRIYGRGDAAASGGLKGDYGFIVE